MAQLVRIETPVPFFGADWKNRYIVAILRAETNQVVNAKNENTSERKSLPPTVS